MKTEFIGVFIEKPSNNYLKLNDLRAPELIQQLFSQGLFVFLASSYHHLLCFILGVIEVADYWNQELVLESIIYTDEGMTYEN